MGDTQATPIRRQEPVYQHWMEAADFPLYDTIYLPFGAKGRRAMGFVDPIGNVISTNEGHKTKDWTDTNLWEPGFLPHPHAFFIEEITCGFVKGGEIVSIRSPFYPGTILEFSINNKLYWNSPVTQVAEPAAFFVDDDERKTALTRDLFHFLRRPLGCPLLINTAESFKATARFDDRLDLDHCGMAGGGPDKLVIFLRGRYYRAVV